MNHLRMRVDRVVTVMIAGVSIVREKERKKSRMMKMGSGRSVVKQTYPKKNDINHLISLYILIYYYI